MVKEMSLYWKCPPASYELPKDELHVWCLSLDRRAAEIDDLSRLLAVEEVARADRFRFPQHRRRFIARRGLARTLLGRYLDMSPEGLEFATNEYGKPYLLSGTDPSSITFNLSHSWERALLVVGRERALGIDIERIDAKRADQDIAEAHFSATEIEALKDFNGDQWTEGFFRCWSRKEAFIKAVGKGLSLPLDRFAVSLAIDQAPLLLDIAPGLGYRLSDWSLYELPAVPEYATALAVQGSAPVIQCFREGR